MTRRPSRDAGSPRQISNPRMHNSEFFYDQKVVPRSGITTTDFKPQNAEFRGFFMTRRSSRNAGSSRQISNLRMQNFGVFLYQNS